MPENGIQITPKGVHSQDFGDEIVVINLNTGKYFSLRGGAVQIWTRIGKNSKATLSAIQQKFEQKENDSTILHLIKKWLEEGILEETEAVHNLSTDDLEEKIILQSIEFEVYDDMQALLLLDPIHDVDAKVGWPKQK